MKNRHFQKAIPLVEEEKRNISLLDSMPAGKTTAILV
jgi:hypothetical protein